MLSYDPKFQAMKTSAGVTVLMEYLNLLKAEFYIA